MVLEITADRSRTTLGEISDALEQVYGRYQAKNRTVSGVYSSEIENSKIFKNVQKKAIQFENRFGRRPRIMVAKIGQDGHDRGARVIATSFADLRSEEHTSELQSRGHLVCRLLLEKK